MHHHGFGVVDGDAVVLRPSLQSVQRVLQHRVVWHPIVAGDADCAVIHVFPSMWDVSKGVADHHQKTQWPHLGPLGHPADQLAKRGDRSLITDGLLAPS